MNGLSQMLCVVALATHAVATESTLKYFGVWELESADPVAENVKDFANFLFTSGDMDTINKFSAAGVGPSLFMVESIFFTSTPTGLILRPDYKERWATVYTSTVRPGLANHTLFGVFFGDELVWQCLSYDNLTTAIDLVRSDLPRGTAILYQNEAFPTFTGTFEAGKSTPGLCEDPAGTQHHINYPSVPPGLDWISIDYYPDEGTVEGTQKIYTEIIYPMMASNQYALFVPPAYGASDFHNTTDNATMAAQLCCSQTTRDGPNPPCHGNCSAAMIDWAVGVYNWARNDPRIIGLNPWHWTTASGGSNKFEPGLTDLPDVQSTYRKIGHEIITGRLGDI